MRDDLVFLTGGSGFVGRHVLRELRAAGYRVRALVRKPDDQLVDCEQVTGDLEHPGDLARRLAGCRYLIHCAALYSFAPADRPAMRRVNVGGTESILAAAHVAGLERAVVTSSSATVGPAHGSRLATEEDHAGLGHDRHSSYHASKLEQERVALSARIPVVLLLPSAPVGPGDAKPTPTGGMILDFARGRMVVRPPGGGLNLVPVEDVARAHVVALERGRPGERYLIGGENLSLDEIWKLLAELTGRPLPRRRIAAPLAFAVAYADELRCRIRPGAKPFAPLEGLRMAYETMYVDSEKAQRELGYRAGPVRDALARSIAWFRAHGYVEPPRVA